MEGKKSLVDQLNEFLECKLVSIVGGGGKTSFMYSLAKELAFRGKKVVLTTTTHIAVPGPDAVGMVIANGNIEQVKQGLKQHNIIAVATGDQQGKLSSIDLELLEEIKEIADVILCEADGTRGLPFKAPRDYEPVIAPGTDIVVAVCGILGLGKSIAESCHRPDLASELLGKNQQDCMEARDLGFLLLSEQGQYKDVTEEHQYIILINQVDGKTERAMADEVIEYLLKNGAETIILSAFQAEYPIKEIIKKG